jgi:hypothetical protein
MEHNAGAKLAWNCTIIGYITDHYSIQTTTGTYNNLRFLKNIGQRFMFTQRKLQEDGENCIKWTCIFYTLH